MINYGTRARLGMILPSGNQVAEPLFNAMLPAGVSLHTTRLKLTGSSDKELQAMTERLEDAAQLVADAEVDLVLFHCTAVTTWDESHEQSIKDRIAAASERPVTATSEAILAALRKMNAERIVMLSPYIEAINRREVAYFTNAGFTVLHSAGLDKGTAHEMAAVTPADWLAFARAHSAANADAYLLSCTTVRTSEVAETLETEFGCPVITSNIAAVWFCLRRMSIADRVDGYGRLFREH
ncbi:MAG: arylmalonate decarboxylase [Rhodoplanes sp.]